MKKSRTEEGSSGNSFKFNLKMKLTTLLLVVSLFKIQANTYSQNTKISLNLKEVTVKETISAIESKTEFRFFYEQGVVDLDRIITINAKREKVFSILNRLFSDTNTFYEVLDRQIMLKHSPKPIKESSSAEDVGAMEDEQDIQVSGTVSDSNGTPLPGASVLEKGTTNGTQSDFDGNFTLTLSDENATLVISYLGFATKEVGVNGQTNLTITLVEDAAGLEEVVVIGYGTQKKKEVSGSVAQVKGEDLQIAPVASLSNTLTGRLPGLTVTSNSAEPGREANTILIRGVSGFNDNSPLIVIDGVAGADGLARLDPNDIESISVLKDAAAAIYGARAANGVILVTTKRGRTGKPQFSISTNLGINSPIGLMEVADGVEYATYLNRYRWKAAGWDPNFTPWYTDQEIADIRSGVTPSYDWVGDAFQDFTQTNTNINVRGGGEKITYFASARYLEQGSTYKFDNQGGNKQYNIRTNLDIKASDNLNIGLDMSFRHQDVVTSAGVFTGSLQTAGLTSPLREFYVNGDTRYPAWGRVGQSHISMNNDAGYFADERQNQSIRLHFKYEIPGIEGLSLSGFGSANLTNEFSKDWRKPWKWYGDGSGNGSPTDPPQENIVGNTSLNERFERGQLLTGNLSANYDKAFGDHTIGILAQVEKQENKYDWFSGGNDAFDTSASDQLTAGSGDRSANFSNGSASENARINYSSRVNYNYKGKYFLQGVFRYDGSERFAKDQRFGFFPGISGSWLMSEEDFLKDNNTISSLKLRASWSQLGNDNVPAFNYLSSYAQGGNTVFNGALSPGYRESGVSNPDTTWEVHEVINFGVEGAFFNNKLNLELEFFKDNISGLFATPDEVIPDYLGIPIPQTNIGKAENKGFEVLAGFRDQIGEDFTYSLGFTYGYSKNKIIDIDEPERDAETAHQSREGHQIGADLSYTAIGIFRTQADLDNHPHPPGRVELGTLIFDDYNDDGVIDSKDQTRQYRSFVPTSTFGITGHFTYKNWDLDMLWQGTAGGKKSFWTFFTGDNNGLAYVANNTWDPNNVDAPWPMLHTDYGSFWNNDFFYFDNDYIRLKSLELGYNVPKNVVEKIGLDGLRLYTSGYNLLTFSSMNKYGMTDVEQQSNLTWDYPNLRTINFGLNVTF